MHFFSFTLSKPVIYFMGGEFTASNSWKHHPRYHKGDYEIIFCLSGIIYLQIDSQKFIIKPNQIVIIPPYTHLKGYKESDIDVDFYWLHFFPQSKVMDFTDDEKNIIPKLKSHHYNAKNLITLPEIFDIANPDEMAISFHRLLSENGKFHFLEKRDYLTSALLIELFETYVTQHDYLLNHAKIERVKEWITANMSSSLNVNEIAKNVHLNRNYLTRIFKKYTGMTTLQYLVKLKIELASLLLLRTEMSVKEISSAAYFTTPKMFMRRFKIETGFSPTEYRNKYSTILQNNSHIDPFIPVPSRISDSINDGVTEDIRYYQHKNKP